MLMTSRSFFLIKSKKKLIKVFFDDVILIKALGNHIELHTDDDVLISYSSLKVIKDKLPPEFKRVHNSFIINLKHLYSFEENLLTMKGHTLFIGRMYKKSLLASIENFIL